MHRDAFEGVLCAKESSDDDDDDDDGNSGTDGYHSAEVKHRCLVRKDLRYQLQPAGFGLRS